MVTKYKWRPGAFSWACAARYRTICLFCLTLLFWCATGNSGNAAEPPQSVPEVLAKLREWRQNFISTRVVWRSWNRQDFIDANPEGDPEKALGVTFYAETEFQWADWGGYRREVKTVINGGIVDRWLMGGNGEQSWKASTVYRGNPDVWSHMELYPPESSRPLATTICFDALFGLWNCAYGDWIDHYLSHESVELLEGTQEFDSRQCLVFRVKRLDEPWEQYFWLDLGHECLPCKMEQHVTLDEKKIHDITWVASGFDKFGGTVWWPSSGYYLFGPERRELSQWSLKSVTLNESIARSDIQAPTGTPGVTKIIDYVHGDVRRTPGAPPAANPDTSTAETPKIKAGTPVEATPPSSPWWLLGLAGGLLMLLGLILRYARRSHQ